jgi:hypothetical protein
LRKKLHGSASPSYAGRAFVVRRSLAADSFGGR